MSGRAPSSRGAKRVRVSRSKASRRSRSRSSAVIRWRTRWAGWPLRARRAWIPWPLCARSSPTARSRGAWKCGTRGVPRCSWTATTPIPNPRSRRSRRSLRGPMRPAASRCSATCSSSGSRRLSSTAPPPSGRVPRRYGRWASARRTTRRGPVGRGFRCACSRTSQPPPRLSGARSGPASSCCSRRRGARASSARSWASRRRPRRMFYEWVYPLHDVPGLSALNVFRYITFRSAYAAISALLVCFIMGPPMIEWLRRVRLGQKVRAEGPQSHLSKAGTPTMGGILIVSAIIVPTLLWGNLHSRPLWLAMIATVWLGAIGFLDDYLRVVKGLPKGLLGRYKLAGQVAIGLAVGLTLVFWPEPGLPATATQAPFIKSRVLDFGWLFVPFVVLVITGSSNAVNLTDGLDGLASGLMAIAALTFAGMCYLSGHLKFSQYLNIPHLSYGGELTVFCSAVLGASL